MNGIHILHLETSGRVCSVAVSKDNVVVAKAEVAISHSHADVLGPMALEVLKWAGLYNGAQLHKDAETGGLVAVAVSLGPGSYTGLRIGMAFAKGFALGHGVQLTGVPTHEIMAMEAAHVAPAGPKVILSVQDARRKEVYLTPYLSSGTGLIQLKDTQNIVLDDAAWPIYLSEVMSKVPADGHLMVVGDGAAKVQEVISANPNVQYSTALYPKAAFMAQQAYERLLAQDFLHLPSAVPYYLKPWVGNATTIKKQGSPAEVIPTGLVQQQP